jgi:hypothetical protein
MRIKLFMTAFIAFFCCAVYSQSCLPEGITFETQAQINNFQANYPGCTEIMGNVRIRGSNITNLNGLSVLTSIHGYFLIGDELDAGNPLLTSLTGLEGLTSIGGNLWISGNNVLNSLTGLDNIEAGSITKLYIYDNVSLSTCEVQSVCNYLADPNGSINIYNNATGCMNPPEVAEGCGITLQCLPHGNYYARSQSEVDSFPVNYPGCTILEGHVNISGSDISNLYGLSGVTSIGKTLFIENNNELTSLKGLEGLASIGGWLDVEDNNALTTMDGLDGLTTIGGDLYIHTNSALDSLAGLEGLTSVGGFFTINHNDSLVNLSGLDNLISIGNDIEIYNSPLLTSLAALENLTSIGGWLEVVDNNKLVSLAGLDHIDGGSIHGLQIVSNDSLSICEVQSVCEYLARPDANIEILFNASGCRWKGEVELACGFGVTENNSSNYLMTISPNPSSTRITIETTASTPKFLISIFNLNGQEVLSQQITESKTEIDISHLPCGIYFVKLTSDDTVKVLKIVKE